MRHNAAMNRRSHGQSLIVAFVGVAGAALFTLLATLLAYPTGASTLDLHVAPALTASFGTRGSLPQRRTAGAAASSRAFTAKSQVRGSMWPAGMRSLAKAGVDDIPESVSGPGSRTRPAIFNSLSAVFFGVLVYLRRKAARKMYALVDVENPSKPWALATISGTPKPEPEPEPELEPGPITAWSAVTGFDYSLVACVAFWYTGASTLHCTCKLISGRPQGPGGLRLVDRGSVGGWVS